MIKDEGNRIVTAGLVKNPKELSDYINPKLSDVLKMTANKNIILGALAEVHNTLQSVKLPGDFKKISTSNNILSDIIEDNVDDIKPLDQVLNGIVHDDSVDKKVEERLANLNSKLYKIAYDLGKNGHHEAAYLIERAITKINGDE
jgi:hypothetical protein